MASSHVQTFTDKTFDADVLKSPLPTLVDFWAVWCGPCKQIAPMVDALAEAHAGKLRVGKVDVDHEQITAQQLRITSIPTLLLFKGGKVVWQHVGALSRAKLDAAIAPHLG